jgi:hypothetical protein
MPIPESIKPSSLRRQPSKLLQKVTGLTVAVDSSDSLPSPPPLPPPKHANQLYAEDFTVKGLLSFGTQGKIFVVKHRTGMRALKVTDKAVACKNRITDLVMNEQRIMKQLHEDPFVAQLEGSFHDSHFFYLVMVRLLRP